MKRRASLKEIGRLESQTRLGKMLVSHYVDAHEIRRTRSQPIAWASLGAPHEILWNMGFTVLFPEAYAATCGAKHAATHHCEITEGKGYENHLCTYARNSIGSVIADLEVHRDMRLCGYKRDGVKEFLDGLERRMPFQPLARPDLLLTASNSCIVVQKWWEHLSQYLRVPLIAIDTPYVANGVDTGEILAYVKQQCLDLISFLENMTGVKFDYDRLAEIVKRGETCGQLYHEALQLNKADPPPMSWFDLMAHNFVNLALRYTEEAAEHYHLLVTEVKDRVANGVVAFPGARYRVYWDGIPYWFALRSLSEILRGLGLCPITSNYDEIFLFPYLDSSRPLDSIVENTALLFLNRSIEYKAERVKQLCTDFNLDGGIFAYAMTCKPFSIVQKYIADVVERGLGLPCVTIDGDLVDHRFYEEEATKLRLQAFAETIEGREKT